MKVWGWVVVLWIAAVLVGGTLAVIQNIQIKKAIRRADSLAVVSDSLRKRSDSLLTSSRKIDSVFIREVVTKLVTKWDTVRIDSMVYVPIAQADSVKDQRDRCIVAWSACAQARDTLERSRDLFVEQNKALKERIARDSARTKSPHLEIVGAVGPGAVVSPTSGRVTVGIGATLGLKFFSWRIF